MKTYDGTPQVSAQLVGLSLKALSGAFVGSAIAATLVFLVMR